MAGKATPIRSFKEAVAALGWRDGMRYAFWRFVEYFPPVAPPYTYRVKSSLLKHPLVCRRGTSDIQVFRQVFIEQQYQSLAESGSPRLIVDCGANVGFTSAYFLSLFPNVRVIAVEPDPDNFRMLTKNLAPFADRFDAVQAGIWSHVCDLTIADATSGRGNEWARQCRPAIQPASDSIRAVDMPSLLRDHQIDEVDILKVDIEGAEEVLFDSSCCLWINKVRAFAIEFHSDVARKVFLSAVAALNGEFSETGEITNFRVAS